MNKGKLVVEGNLNELLNDSDRVVEIRVNRPQDALGFLKSAKPNFPLPDLSDGVLKFSITLEAIPDTVALLTTAGFRIYGVESRRQLEDLFLRLTESAERMRISPVKVANT
jgi:ABC-type multidrug transport system ATPase subunit